MKKKQTKNSLSCGEGRGEGKNTHIKNDVFKTFTLLIIILIATTNLFAFIGWQEGEHDGTPGLEFQRIGTTQNVEVRRGTASATHMIIPQSVTVLEASYSVTVISGSGFSDFTYMTSVTIPNSVITIEWSAFRECIGLTSLTFESPSSVISISNGAFFGCTGLTSITIPSSVTSIGSSAFDGCTGLTSVAFESPSSVTSIGWAAFFGCTGLTSITIPSSVTSIGSSAFGGCTGLTSISVQAGNPVFRSEDNCVIRIDNNELIIGIQTSIIPHGVTSIGSSAFYRCTGLTSITIPNSVTSIGNDAFYYCTGLTSVTFESPSNVTSIGGGAFSRCTGLTSIIIPSSVASIERNPFSGCTGLTSITVQAGNPVFRSEDNCVIRIDNNELIIGIQTSIIPYGVTSIGHAAFFGITSLTSITIPNSVTSIGDFAFGECTGLTSVIFGAPSSVTSIGSYAFYRCTGLTGITIPNSVTIMERLVFLSCYNLVIYVEASSKPAGWDIDWNPDNRPVVWGHVSEDDIIEPALMTALLGNFPNPFNPTTSIKYQVSGITHVEINVYNVRGQRVRNLLNDHREPGHHSVVWDGRDDDGIQLSSGVYFVRMIADEYIETRRMMLMK